MVVGTQPLGKPVAAIGGLALACVVALTLGTVLALFTRAGDTEGLAPSDWAAIRFTVMQAVVSAVLSVLLAVPLARALVRRRFRGRDLFVTLLGAPFLLPVIVAVLGLLAVWGRAGYVSTASLAMGAGRLDIYGLTGILLAHVFFNLPLVTRLLLQGWGGIPATHFRLAGQLGFGPRAMFRHLEAPMLRQVLPGAFLLVFLLCMTSFAVALTLGGGPRATTIEVAIYQALRFNFDLGTAARLALVQFTLCAAAAAAALALVVPVAFGKDLTRAQEYWGAHGRVQLWTDRTVLWLATLLLGAPLLAIALRSAPSLISGLPYQVWPALARSLAVALGSAALAFALALALSLLIDALRARGLRAASLAEATGLLALAVSPFVLGTGLFILISPIADPFSLSLPVTTVTNALMSLPFALRALLPALARVRRDYGHLADGLGMAGWPRFRIVTWPQIRCEAGFATGLAAALSMGDFGVIALFAPPEGGTLPLLMHRLMGAYRMEDAAGVALLLVGCSLGLFWAFDRGGHLGRSF